MILAFSFGERVVNHFANRFTLAPLVLAIGEYVVVYLQPSLAVTEG